MRKIKSILLDEIVKRDDTVLRCFTYYLKSIDTEYYTTLSIKQLM